MCAVLMEAARLLRAPRRSAAQAQAAFSLTLTLLIIQNTLARTALLRRVSLLLLLHINPV